MENFGRYIQALFNLQLVTTAFKVALIVGTILFTHGAAVVQGKINRDRSNRLDCDYKKLQKI